MNQTIAPPQIPILQIGLGDQLLGRAAPHRATELELKRDAAATFQSLR